MSVSFDAVLAAARAETFPSRRIAYGDGPLAYGELSVPANGSGKRPVVVFIHGGCWLSEYRVDHVAAVAGALARAGYAVWAPEYRRLGDDGGGWPGTFEDVGNAIDHLRVIARSHPSIDESRVVLAGHSAGGQLALWAAGRSAQSHDGVASTQAPLAPIGVLALAAITDLAAYGAAAGGCNASVRPLLGGTPDVVPERYRAVSPIERLPLGVPAILVHGAEDAIVPEEMSRGYVRRAQSDGDHAELVSIGGAGHFDVVAPQSEAWRAVLAALNRLAPPG